MRPIKLAIMPSMIDSVHGKRSARQWQESNWYLIVAAAYFVLAAVPVVWYGNDWKDLFFDGHQVATTAGLWYDQYRCRA